MLRWLRFPLYILLILAALPVVLTPLYAFIAPPFTPFMLIRSAQTGILPHYSFTPLSRISRHLPRAVIAAEDNLFCTHNGFDWTAIQRALNHNERGGKLKGGSTITQQLAKNLFLWPARSWVRKGLEVPLTWWLETTLSKHRILELYLNVVEWGPGRFGVAAAAKYHFGTTPAKLSRMQAARLAAILPSPIRYKAANPGPYMLHRSGSILRRLTQLGELTSCITKNST